LIFPISVSQVAGIYRVEPLRLAPNDFNRKKQKQRPYKKYHQGFSKYSLKHATPH
jgi:hypothetical protein